MSLKDKINNLPTNSGVYLMKNLGGEIIYVGKARNLKNRVRQYFSKNIDNVKVRAMVEKIADFEIIITPDEVNALVLENILIKEHKPHYNILLKDDKQYPYIMCNLKEKYPRLTLTRKLQQGKYKFFGPYMNGISVKEVLETVNSIFKIRTCKVNLDSLKSSHRACLNYHIDRCSAPCKNLISEEEYECNLRLAFDFLSGETKKAQEIIKSKMLEASMREDYESAIYYRQRLEVIDKLYRKQVSSVPQPINYDVLGAYSDSGYVCICLMIVRNGKILGSDNYHLENNELQFKDVISEFLIRYYHNNSISCDKIVVSEDVDDVEIIQDYLKGEHNKTVAIQCLKRGVGKQLIDMAVANATNSLNQYINNSERKDRIVKDSLLMLSSYLNLDNLHRIECYDNSNISGTNAVSSMIVFIDGQPATAHYRKFKVKTVVGADDFATMKEVLKRRLDRLVDKNEKDISFSDKPNLIILDGGKGQLSSGYEIVKDYDYNINLISLAKQMELIFTVGSNEPIVLPYNSKAYMLIQRIRDEAHRFAITFHRSLRTKSQTQSMLLDIDGVGDVRQKQIIAHFKTISALKEATVNDIMKIPRMPKELAERIYKHIHNKD